MPTESRNGQFARSTMTRCPARSSSASSMRSSGAESESRSPCTRTTVAASVVDFLLLHYASNGAILNGNGFDVVPSAFATAINNVFLTAPGKGSTNTLNIGNTTVCGAIAGR